MWIKTAHREAKRIRPLKRLTKFNAFLRFVMDEDVSAKGDR
jgi:hypothetical protein